MSIRRHLDGRYELPPEAHAALDAGSVGAFVADASRIYDANDAFLELVGFTRDELEAGTLSWLLMTVPGYLADDARAIGQLRSTGRADVYEKEFYRRDGVAVRVRLADILLEVEPLRIFAFVADAGDEHQRGVIDAVDAATRAQA